MAFTRPGPEAIRQFNNTLRYEAAMWDPGIELFGKPGEPAIYASAAHHLTRIIAPIIPAGLNIQATGKALNVAGCLVQTIARLGRQGGLTQPEVVRIARAGDSHHTLVAVASTTRRLANAIEGVAGMRGEPWVDDATALRQYELREDGVRFKDVLYTANIATIYGGLPPVNEDSLPEGKCPAPALGLIMPCLSAMVEVADLDPRLIAATLNPIEA